jgi:hypothetical protein
MCTIGRKTISRTYGSAKEADRLDNTFSTDPLDFLLWRRCINENVHATEVQNLGANLEK